MDYPLLNFRNVTYFPMTYDYATKEFNWATQWVPGKFTLVSHAGSDYTQLVIVRKDSDGAVLWSSRSVKRQLKTANTQRILLVNINGLIIRPAHFRKPQRRIMMTKTAARLS